MNKNAIIKSLRISYVVSLIAALAVVLAFEFDLIEEGAFAKLLSSTMVYALQVVTVMLTVILIPLAVKGFTKSLEKAKALSEYKFTKLFFKKSLIRMFLLFIVILVNIFVYYGLGYNGALYCGLFGLGSMIYSFPTKMVFEHYFGEKE